jgi:hypothetical protein
MVAFWNQAIELTWGELIISMFAGVGIAMTVMTLVSIIRDSLRRRTPKGKRRG